ncbi:hypothetical protein EVAR_92622_1 [Eumeta japonica]|uniref:Uncharacterized protein n=1 Tax=Eumeta variegata TaxID=151549 RepID=A0A4C1T077_EUMVA|nr:hypothetical protein EVAR_92622_1 [Eumeta japonica]
MQAQWHVPFVSSPAEKNKVFPAICVEKFKAGCVMRPHCWRISEDSNTRLAREGPVGAGAQCHRAGLKSTGRTVHLLLSDNRMASRYLEDVVRVGCGDDGAVRGAGSGGPKEERVDIKILHRNNPDTTQYQNLISF